MASCNLWSARDATLTLAGIGVQQRRPVEYHKAAQRDCGQCRFTKLRDFTRMAGTTHPYTRGREALK